MKATIRIVGALALMAVAVFSLTGCYTKPEAGEIGVVRNGGPFDNHNIRGIVPNGAGNTWNGWASSTHYYPVDTQQRFFRMATCYDKDGPFVCDGADAAAITVPTSDGVDVTIEGTFYLNTVFNDSKVGEDAVKAFDTQFSTRTFDGKHPYEGPGGYSAFLGAIVEPIVVNNTREVISGTSCADLVSSCALVQNQTTDQKAAADAVQQKAAGGANQSNISKVQSAVESGLGADLKATLGQSYFKNIQFKLQRVLLPSSVQGAINEAQSAFAQVSQAQARVQSAVADAKANEERQKGYNACDACRQIDAIKAWRGTGVTTVVQGGGSAVSVGGK